MAVTVTVTISIIMAMLSWQGQGSYALLHPALSHCCWCDIVADIADSAALHTFYAYHCAIDMLLMLLGQYRKSYRSRGISMTDWTGDVPADRRRVIQTHLECISGLLTGKRCTISRALVRGFSELSSIGAQSKLEMVIGSLSWRRWQTGREGKDKLLPRLVRARICAKQRWALWLYIDIS